MAIKDVFINIEKARLWPASKIHNWSDDHISYMASGECPRCSKILMNKLFGLEKHVNYKSLQGQRLAECGWCGFTWNVEKNGAAGPPTSSFTIEIVEVSRSDEDIGKDVREIDNSTSSVPVTRKFSFSKEWKKNYKVEYEKIKSSLTELSIGSEELGSLKSSSEEKLRAAYSISTETKEFFSEDVSCDVPARTRLIMNILWKRIWQHGVIKLNTPQGCLDIPYRVLVGLTFDLQQTEAGATSDGRRVGLFGLFR